jgi:hypothetical protein
MSTDDAIYAAYRDIFPINWRIARFAKEASEEACCDVDYYKSNQRCTCDKIKPAAFVLAIILASCGWPT